MLLHPFIDRITPSINRTYSTIRRLLVPVTEWNNPLWNKGSLQSEELLMAHPIPLKNPWSLAQRNMCFDPALTCFIPSLECCFKSILRFPVTRITRKSPNDPTTEARPKKPRQVARQNLLDPWWSSLFKTGAQLGSKKWGEFLDGFTMKNLDFTFGFHLKNWMLSQKLN